MIAFFERFPEVRALFSEKGAGSMRWILQSDEPFARVNRANRARFFGANGIDPERVITPGLVHGNTVRIVTKASDAIPMQTDALVTRETEVFLTVTAADCLPVFFYDPARRVIGLAHAGWRGVARGIVPEAVKALRSLGAQERDTLVAIGPHIRACHFAIGEDAKAELASYPESLLFRDEKTFAELGGMVQEQLVKAGVPSDNITTSPLCTHCEAERFFSYRRDRPQEVEAMVAVIGLGRR